MGVEEYNPEHRDMGQSESVLGVAKIREQRGITLHQIADTTKISMQSLKAIESGEFKKLPGGIYDTNYIRQYCRAIDYDESLLLAAYYRATGIAPNSPGSSAATPSRLAGGFRPASATGRP